MRDHWNDVVAVDPEATKAEVIEIIKKAGTLTYSEIQELRNSAELCDRSHFQWAVKRIADKIGETVPKDLDIIMEDPDFDVRVSFMAAVVKAVDPFPVQPRVNPRAKK